MNKREGELITRREGRLSVPDRPVIPFIAGDGTGPEIIGAVRVVLDAAVEKAYGSERSLVWKEIYAGETAQERSGSLLPEETVEAIARHRVAIKGPLTTPVGGGFRSLNVTMRQRLQLFANVRPARWFEGLPSPLKEPWKVDMITFRENTEDVYAGIEWPAGSDEAKSVRAFLEREMGVKLREETGIGVKPMSREGTERLVRMALKHAIEQGSKSVTIVHKGNIMKFTEGAFRDWSYELAEREFGGRFVKEWDENPGKLPVLKDRIADNMFQQILLRPAEYDVLATPNLNGDYLSDALAACVGGLGFAPGANIGDGIALFEPVHGTAPKYAGKNMINPSSGLLSGKMMLDHLGWREAAELVKRGVENAVKARMVTYDVARHLEGVEPLSTSDYADAVVGEMGR